MSDTAIADALRGIRQRIHRACERQGRDPAGVTLVAVSKRKPAEAIRTAYAAAGQRAFGENYVQELVSKAAALSDLSDLQWHCIGHVQKNKAREVVQIAAMAETVDRLSLVSALQRRAAAADRWLDVLIQVNISGEQSKSGCEPGAVGDLIGSLRDAPRLHLRGLMTMPPYLADPEDVRPYFRRLRELREAHGGEQALPELSMGMSHDFEVAIEEGATIVRVGSAIFGPRPE